MPQGVSAYAPTPIKTNAIFDREALSGAQLFYAESDRPLMDEAWEMMAAHREDLVSRASGAVPRLALPAVPLVLAMLQRQGR